MFLVGIALAKPVTEGTEQLRELPKTELEKTKAKTETLITKPLQEFVKGDLIEKRLRRDTWEYQLPGQDFNIKLSENYGLPSEEYGPPAEEYGPPAEEYGPPAEEYGPPPQEKLLPSTTEHYCPEEDIVPPFALAPPAPSALPLPVPEPTVFRNEYGPPAEEYGPPAEEYGPPAEEYGPPAEEYGPPIVAATTTTETPYIPEIYYSYPPVPAVIEYGPPAIPDLPPFRLAPYPAPAPLTTTTEAAPLPPLAPYPAPAPLTTTLPPLKLAPYPPPAPYPAPIPIPAPTPAPAPLTTTEAATLPPARLAPYPPPALKESPYAAAVESTYERTSGGVEARPHSVLRYVKPLLLKKKIVRIAHPKKLLKRHLLKFFG